jgi:hypothetical protein
MNSAGNHRYMQTSYLHTIHFLLIIPRVSRPTTSMQPIQLTLQSVARFGISNSTMVIPRILGTSTTLP